MARVLLGVTGGIAAYKACELCRLLVKDGHEVIPLLTPGAERFVTAETFDALARRPRGDDPYPHLENADLLVIAPLTANTLAKLAYGLADSVLTEAALAHRGPILVAPAMNHRMWEHPATQLNAAALRDRGVELIGPEEGELAEGEWGMGRMTEPEAIHARCSEHLGLSNTVLLGKKVLVSAGGTREPLDSARWRQRDRDSDGGGDAARRARPSRRRPDRDGGRGLGLPPRRRPLGQAAERPGVLEGRARSDRGRPRDARRAQGKRTGAGRLRRRRRGGRSRARAREAGCQGHGSRRLQRRVS